MKFLTRAFALLCMVTLLTSIPVYAQRGKIIKHPTQNSLKGIHTDSEPPITNSEVWIYRVGSAVNAQPSSMVDCSLYGDPSYANVGSDDGGNTCYVQADSGGNFDLTGTFDTCNGSSDILYFEAKGGDVGGTGNSQLALLAVPPSAWNCGYLQTHLGTTIIISDFTNVMAAFAAGTFANYSNSPFDGIATYSASFSALGVAFDAANAVVPISSGYYAGSDSNVQKQLNTLADVIARCIDSAGTIGSGSPCGDLYSATTQGAFSSTHTPINTWQSIASMGQYPYSSNVGTQYGLISAFAPWQPFDSTAPSAWTVPVSGGPTLSSSNATTAVKNTTSFDITGTNLLPGSGSPTVVIAGQNATVDLVHSSSTDLKVTIPSHAATGAMGVYVSGVASNFRQFAITN